MNKTKSIKRPKPAKCPICRQLTWYKEIGVCGNCEVNDSHLSFGHLGASRG